MAQLATIATIASVAGTVVSAVGTIAAGQAAARDAEFQAQQLDIQAKDEFAASQREAEEIRRNKELVLSRQQALASASGMGATDDSIVSLAAETAGFGKYQELSALAAGAMRRRNAEYGAASARATGQAQKTGALFQAGGTILGGFGNVFQQKYGTGGYKPAGAGYGAAGRWYG